MKIIVVSSRRTTPTSVPPSPRLLDPTPALAEVKEELSEEELEHKAAVEEKQRALSSIERLHKDVTTKVLGSIVQHDWNSVIKELSTYRALKGHPRESRKILATLINRAQSSKEILRVDETDVDVPSTVSKFTRGLAAVEDACQAAKEEVRTRQEVADAKEETTFDSAMSKGAVALRQQVMDKGFAQGKASVTFIMDGALDRSVLKQHFNVSFLGPYPVFNELLVVGVSAKYAKKHDAASPAEAVAELAKLVVSRMGSRYEVIERKAVWQDASWALIMSKKDLHILGQAGGGGRFQLKSWNFAYQH